MKNYIAISFTIVLFGLNNGLAFADEHSAKPHKKGKLGKAFALTDANQDGRLDLSEFLAHAEQRFNAMDLNQDGYVTKDEGREAHKKMREKRKAKRMQRREERQEKRQERLEDS